MEIISILIVLKVKILILKVRTSKITSKEYLKVRIEVKALSFRHHKCNLLSMLRYNKQVTMAQVLMVKIIEMKTFYVQF